jgi:hypothetical protein
VRGYEEAGKYLASNPHGRSILYYGNYEGSIILGIRKYLTGEAPFFLRGDRHLSMRLWWGELRENSKIKNTDQIKDFIRTTKTGYVVIENNMPKADKFEEYIKLKDLVRDKNNFEKIATFDLKTNAQPLGTNLNVYKVIGKKLVTSDEIKVNIPASGLRENIKIHNKKNDL